ncbi:hypothetical protein AMJ57_05520, partial [Parcubacteria bacterium SG8_24]
MARFLTKNGLKTAGIVLFSLGLAITSLYGGGVFDTWFPTDRATAAACPFVDGDVRDADPDTDEYQLSSNYSVSGSATAYDCTSFTSFVIPSGVTLTLQGNTSTGDIARMDFTNLTVNSNGVISADSQGCVDSSGDYSGYGPDSSNICTYDEVGAGKATGNLGGSGGGGHGGNGGRGADYLGGSYYDSATAPVLFGSSGGTSYGTSGGTGGGVVRLDVSGTFTHNGTIRANGSNGEYLPANLYRGSGGGSGGSVYLTVGTLAGSSGTFEAHGGGGGNGSSDDGGGGGGGRIAITYASSSFSGLDSSDFDVNGGSGNDTGVDGDKGTVYVRDTTNNDVWVYHGFTYEDTDWNVRNWTSDTSATNQYCSSSAVSPSITTTGTLTFGGTLDCSSGSLTSYDLSAATLAVSASTSMTIAAASTWTATTDFSIGSGTSISITQRTVDLEFDIPDGDDQTWDNVTIAVNAQGGLVIDDAIDIALTNGTDINASVDWTNLTGLSLASGTTITADERGCIDFDTDNHGYGPNSSNVCTYDTAGAGQGTTGAAAAGGGGYGGAGGDGDDFPGGIYYGSNTAPVLMGSSGGSSYGNAGGRGGGYVRIDVSGTFTHNGTITANGGDGTYLPSNLYRSSGGGSGGGIYVTTGVMAGTTGTFEAKGGDSGDGPQDDGGGGAGGRVAITYTSGTFSFDSTDFVMTGGSGHDTGQPGLKGTVYVRDTTNNDVWVYHGFMYDDTDWSAHDWTIDTSATNQYCTTAAVSPSVTASADLSVGGTLSCSPSGLTSFSFSGGSSFAVSSGMTITMTTTGSSLDFNIPAATSVTLDSFTLTGSLRGDFTIDDAATMTVSGTSTITSNVHWTNLAGLSLGSGTTIDADEKGCSDSTGDSHGYGPNTSNVCTYNTGGAGLGNTGVGGSGGGGNGGAGGDGTDYAGGSVNTDNSNTAPTLYGASGGTSYGVAGGIGGGVVRLDITGTFTHNGTIRADGGDGDWRPNNLYRASGGGSGGSIYVTTGTFSGTFGSFSVAGGLGAIGGGTPGGHDDGGSGGGGRVAVHYATDSSSFLSGLTAAGVAPGGAAQDSGEAGDTGTLYTNQTNDPPVVTVVTHSPPSPFIDDVVTISATATDDVGVTEIKLYLD